MPASREEYSTHLQSDGVILSSSWDMLQTRSAGEVGQMMLSVFPLFFPSLLLGPSLPAAPLTQGSTPSVYRGSFAQPLGIWATL
jgi:hypothetical protein